MPGTSLRSRDDPLAYDSWSQNQGWCPATWTSQLNASVIQRDVRTGVPVRLR